MLPTLKRKRSNSEIGPFKKENKKERRKEGRNRIWEGGVIILNHESSRKEGQRSFIRRGGKPAASICIDPKESGRKEIKR